MKKKPRILPLVWLLLVLVVMIASHYFAPHPAYVPPPYEWAGTGFLVFGVIMTVMSAGAFKKADTALVPFDEATALVTDGFFRFTRNPMYLGMVFLLLGLSVMLGSFVSLAPIPFFAWVIHRNFILAEEHFMEAAFGEEYLAYKRRVRRWI